MRDHVRQQVYRKTMQCPRCGSNWLPKCGRSGGRQTCRCGQCIYHFVPDTKRLDRREKVKSLAVSMYSEGCSLEAAGRVLGERTGTVYPWVKKPAGLGGCSGSWPGSETRAGLGHLLR